MNQQMNQRKKKPDQRLGRSGEVRHCSRRREISGSCGALLCVADNSPINVVSKFFNSHDVIGFALNSNRELFSARLQPVGDVGNVLAGCFATLRKIIALKNRHCHEEKF